MKQCLIHSTPSQQASLMRRIERIIMSPGFVIGLTLLFINDYFLKQSFPGAISGKLSDLAGLFIVGLLATAVGGNRPRKLVILSLLFLWWKSPLADPVIAAWNSFGIYQAGRTIDYADSLALVMLPLAYHYERSCPTTNSRRPFVYIIVLFSVIGIMGTSPARYSIYRDIIEQPEPAEANSAPVQRVDFMIVLHEFAQAHKLELVDHVEGSEYRNYSGAEIVLNAHYDRSRRRVYFNVYAKDPYRRSLKEQKSAVNAFWFILERALTERGFSIVPHETGGVSYSRPIIRLRLSMLSPTKGIPFTSGYNGIGNEDIAKAQLIIDDFFTSKGFVRARRDLCFSKSHGYWTDSCRNYRAGRPLGADRDMRAIDAIVQGDVLSEGTVLDVTLQQRVKDDSVSVDVLANELKTVLKKQFSDRLYISIRDLLASDVVSKENP